MPIYEYTCGKCASEFELLLRGGERATCPSCGGDELEKLLSVPAAHAGHASDLPICGTPSPATCGLPKCQMGGCQME